MYTDSTTKKIAESRGHIVMPMNLYPALGDIVSSLPKLAYFPNQSFGMGDTLLIADVFACEVPVGFEATLRDSFVRAIQDHADKMRSFNLCDCDVCDRYHFTTGVMFVVGSVSMWGESRRYS